MSRFSQVCCYSTVAALLMATAPASAAFVVSGSIDGLPVSAQADFSIDGGNPDLLVLTLSNTLGAAMTGLLFTINGADPNLMLVSATGTVDYEGNADPYPGTPNTDLLTVDIGNGQGPPHWELASNPGGELSSVATYEYGLSSIGGSASGYTGIWNGGDLDGDPWGIISANTNVDAAPFTTGSSPKPHWTRESATFVFSGFSGLSLSDIDNNVRFMFGSMPNGTIDTPEPGTALLGLMAAGALVLRSRRRR
ncbi:MAG: hypothetical protein R3C10_20860 [Pirellulales bacterium]